MAIPKFDAGQRVSITRAGRFSSPVGVFKVVRALPSEERAIQYRVKGEAEAFERIVDEGRLEPVGLEANSNV